MMARHAVISGVVQGVGFRWHTRARAEALGVTGWVRNRADGRVEVWIEGPGDRVDSMIAWLRLGPRHARVTSLDLSDEQAVGYSDFEVRR
jgi:acylphosphatase